MAPRHLRTSTAVLTLAAATLVVPGLSTSVLGSPSVASTTGITGPVETNLAATRLDLGTLGGKKSWATALDGTLVVGHSETASIPISSHAFAYDLAAAEPHMIDLGTLDNPTLSYVNSKALAVDGTLVVGWASVGNGRHAFAYDLAAAEPEMIDLGTLGWDTSEATAVDGTVVAGWSRTDPVGNKHAFVYDLAAADPQMIDLGTLGGDSSWAADMDGSIVVGTAGTADGEEHAFACDLAAAEPHMIDLGTLGAGASEAVAVNGTVVVGQSQTASGWVHAFAYDLAAAEPEMIDLGARDERYTRAMDVDGTTVVGTSAGWRSDRPTYAFSYDLAAAEPTMRNLGSVRGSDGAEARAVDGDIVIGDWHVPWQRRSHAYAYDLGATDPHFLDLSTRARDGSEAAAVADELVVGASGVPHHATAWLLRRTTQPMIAYRRVHRRVGEGIGRATIRVTRYGDTDPAVTVRYGTRSWTAEAGTDFVAASGTLRFAPGVTTRTFQVKILDDRRPENREALELTLSGPGDPALLGTPRWSYLRIRPNAH